MKLSYLLLFLILKGRFHCYNAVQPQRNRPSSRYAERKAALAKKQLKVKAVLELKRLEKQRERKAKSRLLQSRLAAYERYVGLR